MKIKRKTRKHMKGGSTRKQVQGFIGQLKQKITSGFARGIKNFTSKMVTKQTKCFPPEIKNRVVNKIGNTVQDLVTDLSDKGLNVVEKVIYAVPVVGNVASIVSAADTAVAAAQNAKNNVIDMKHEFDSAKHEMDIIKEKMQVVEELKRKQEQMEEQLHNRLEVATDMPNTIQMPIQLRGGGSRIKPENPESILNRTNQSIQHFHNSTTTTIVL